MSGLELFEDPNFKGDTGAISLHESTPDLATKNFLNRTSSLRVTGDPWIVFTEINYRGDFQIYREGKHALIPEFDNKIASVKVVKGGLSTPKITLYEDIHYKGKEKILTQALPSLGSAGMDHMISSHKVQSGAWLLYQQEHYEGASMVAVAGDNQPDYRCIGWNDKMRSLKPYSPY
ncbi:epidermal differentiation-specific protein-like [Ascaphus truei]|uniref:epidermal differentiation-specific protein-like n=1 Tax=Ascaphus truei TaxID=8439 RepID=UPI003F592BAA